MAELGKRPGAEKEVELPARKKGKKGNTRSRDLQETVEANPADLVRVIPQQTSTEHNDIVLLSRQDKAPQLQLSQDRLSVTGHKGFRSVRATHGSHVGTLYCEAIVQHLGETGHCRLGWSTKKAEINAPVGYDQFGLGYRDLDGSKVHKALREEHGQPYKEGDVIGMFIHLPAGGRILENNAATLRRYKGSLYHVLEDEPEPKPLVGSVVGFSKNGKWQGVAYSDVLEGTYYPTASLFTLPEQSEGATVQFNFGPDFKFKPPTVTGCPAAEPVSSIPAKQAAAAEAEMQETIAAKKAAADKAGNEGAATNEQAAVPEGQQQQPAVAVHS
eukprot:GHRR01001818.1.p1 GENE.GHRR01001818.1~~GHRR01001818.1.p1  ORF type:complete len:329 (+),score=121.76 GHRR01001818.1:277-1263(+)